MCQALATDTADTFQRGSLCSNSPPLNLNKILLNTQHPRVPLPLRVSFLPQSITKN